MRQVNGPCPLCARDPVTLSKHHLKPKSRGGRETVPICVDCHQAIHQMFSNKQLDREFDSVDALLDDERFGKHVKWLSGQSADRRFQSSRALDQRPNGGRRGRRR